MGYIRFSDEELAVCRNTDLINVCETLGYQVKKVGSFYQLADHDSFMIFNRKNFKWYSNGESGSSIDFLMIMENKSWKESVEWLLHFNGIVHESVKRDEPIKGVCWFHVIADQEGKVKIEKQEKKTAINQAPVIKETRDPFVLPPMVKPERVKKYLVNERKISEAVVDRMIEMGLIMESAKTHNAVFVGYDPQGVPRHASLRGTYKTSDGSIFKGTVAGSDARYSFNIVNQNSNILEVFEAPIDAISYYELMDYYFEKEGFGLTGYNYLALTGIHDRALEEFLKNHPNIDTVYLALDNDQAGENGAKKIKEKYSSGEWEQRNLKIYRDIVPDGWKDYNDFLVASKDENKIAKAAQL